MLTIELNMYHAVALGAFLFWMGGIITDKVRLLNRYCIPAPLVGGLCFSILNCILYSAGIASITFDGTLQTVFMILFFTTVGFTVSIPALLKGNVGDLYAVLAACDGQTVEEYKACFTPKKLMADVAALKAALGEGGALKELAAPFFG